MVYHNLTAHLQKTQHDNLILNRQTDRHGAVMEVISAQSVTLVVTLTRAKTT